MSIVVPLQDVDTAENLHPLPDNVTLQDVARLLVDVLNRQHTLERHIKSIAADVTIIRQETLKNSALRNALTPHIIATRDVEPG